MIDGRGKTSHDGIIMSSSFPFNAAALVQRLTKIRVIMSRCSHRTKKRKGRKRGVTALRVHRAF